MPGTLALQRAPVAFFIFNRPALTARVLAAIAQARPPRLLVVADGPRGDQPEDEALVRQARAVLDEVDWPCEVRRCYSDVNLGCGRRVATGLDWVFSQTDEAIILEDDCVPEPSFFAFCEELLERYGADERVQMVSGCNVLSPEQSGPYSYYFSRCYHIWGWATWARSWRHYDFEMRDWPALRDTRWLERHLRSRTAAQVARVLFEGTYSGQIRQWDFQWAFSGWRRNALAVIPAVNLVSNVGFGNAATHTVDPNHPRANLETQPMKFPLRHPPTVSALEAADRREWELVAARFPASRPEHFRRRMAAALRHGQLRRRVAGALRRRPVAPGGR
jgi:hypothetical protein